MPEIAYRINYTLVQSVDGDETEIGFGSSGLEDNPAAAAFALSSYVENYLWETDPDMPDPDEIKNEIEEGKGR